MEGEGLSLSVVKTKIAIIQLIGVRMTFTIFNHNYDVSQETFPWQASCTGQLPSPPVVQRVPEQ